MTAGRAALLLLLLLAIASPAGSGTAPPAAPPAFAEVDYAKVPRTIGKEPAYVAAPLYALFLFGPKGDVRMWAVLDKSDADSPRYDVLYLDRDADGDLTGPGERIVGKYDERLAAAGISMTVPVGDLPVPGTDEVHREVRVSTVPKAGVKGIWFDMKWCGRIQVSGGRPPFGYDNTQWAPTAAAAPILRPTPEGRLSFGIWAGNTFAIGQECRVSLQIGKAGGGPDTLCYLPQDFLTPGKDRIVAVLVAKDRAGKVVEVPLAMLEPC